MKKAPTTYKADKAQNLGSEFATVVNDLVANYQKTAMTRTKLIDGFMLFLVLLGVLQFVFCVLVGTFPFNAFLGGFASTVGQFVLTANLRIQTNPSNQKQDQFPSVSPERALGDFIFGSLILHFTVYHFIN